MAVREILLLGNPILRTKCAKVKDFNDPSVHKTVDDLIDTLSDFRSKHGFGRGIAAPQIGNMQRIIIVTVDVPTPLINPIIFNRSRKSMTLWDDCFSFPDILVKVKRSTEILVRYWDQSGKKQEIKAVEGMSELIQHEIDHLDGILAVDRAIDSHHIILRSEWEKRFESSKKHLL